MTIASRTLVAFSALALLSACGGDSSVSPTSTPVSLTQVFDEMSFPSRTGTAGARAGISATAFAGPRIPTGCSYAIASQSFVCAPITVGGLTITQSYTLLDAAGAPLAAFDANALSAVRMQSAVSGTETATDITITLDGRDDETLSGLRGSTHTLIGTSTMTSTTTSSAGFGAQTISDTSKTTTNLVIPANATAATYPLSGTITTEMTGGARFLPGPPETIVMTFNGTSKVKITMNGVALSGCSTFDLATASCS